MTNHRSLKIINSFSQQDWKTFSLFLRSPYFNSNHKITKLYHVISREFSEGRSAILSTNSLCKLYGTKSKSTIRNLLAKMLPLLKKYLAHYRFECNYEMFNLNLLNEFEKRKLLKFANEVADELEKSLSSKQKFHISSLHTKFMLDSSKFNIEDFNKPVKNNQTLLKQLQYFDKNSESLFYYYLHNFLQSYIMVQTICNQTGKSIDQSRIGKLKTFLFPDDKLEKVIDKIYIPEDKILRKVLKLDYLHLQIRSNNNLIKNSITYINILKSISKHLHVDEKHNYYTIYHSWFPEILKYPEFQKNEFAFYDDFLKSKAFMSEGHDYMSIRSFIFLYTRGDSTKRYEWTDKLMTKYIHVLNPEFRTSLIHLRNAYLYFRRDKNYELALQELSKVNHLNEIKIKRDFYHLGILIHYELRNFDTVKHLLDNFYKFLKSPAIPEIERTFFAGFIKKIKKLLNLLQKKDSLEIECFKSEIQNDGPFPSKPWMIEKLDELIVLLGKKLTK